MIMPNEPDGADRRQSFCFRVQGGETGVAGVTAAVAHLEQGHVEDQLKIMKTPHSFVGLIASCLISGCATHHLQASKTSSEPVASPTATFAVTNTGTGPLYYQWYFNTNAASATNAGHLPLSYQWWRGTNALPATNR